MKRLVGVLLIVGTLIGSAFLIVSLWESWSAYRRITSPIAVTLLAGLIVRFVHCALVSKSSYDGK